MNQLTKKEIVALVLLGGSVVEVFSGESQVESEARYHTSHLVLSSEKSLKNYVINSQRSLSILFHLV